MLWEVFGNFIFADLAERFCGNHLKILSDEKFPEIITSENYLMMNKSPTEYFAVFF